MPFVTERAISAPQRVQLPEPDTGAEGEMPDPWREMTRQQPAALTPQDASACFSEEEWKLLLEWQNDLYMNVMKDIHQALTSLGPLIATVFSMRAKEAQALCSKDSSESSKGDLIPDSYELLNLNREEDLHLSNLQDSEEGETKDGLGADDAFTDSYKLLHLNREEDLHLYNHQNTEEGETKDGLSADTYLRKEEAVSTFCEHLGFEGGESSNDDSSAGPEICSFPIKEEDMDCCIYSPDIVRRDGNNSTTGNSITAAVISQSVKTEEEMCVEEQTECETSTSENMKTTQNFDRQAFIKFQESKNTKIKTEFDTKMLQTYLTSIGETRQIMELPPKILDEHIADFLFNLKKKDGTEYEPETVRSIIASINRYLIKNEYPRSIFRGRPSDFPETKKTLLAKQKYLKNQGLGNRPRKAEPLSDNDINKLYESGTLGMHNPVSLLNLLFFTIGIQFSLRTQEHYDLQWGDIIFTVDTEGTKYLEYIKRQTKDRTGQNIREIRAIKSRIYENVSIPSRDPIAAYQKYAANRPSAMCRPNSPFYLVPNIKYVQGQSLWFKEMKIGINKMRNMMATMKLESGLPPQKRITNISAIKTSIQKLIENDNLPTQMQYISGHKNLQIHP